MKKALGALALLLAVMSCSVVAAATPVEIIIDNPSASMVGEWTTGTMATNKYGTNYYYCFLSTSGGNSATYTPNIPVTSADWAAYTWYPNGTNRPTAAQYIVHHAGGDSTYYVNQQNNGGIWLELGTYTMNAGTSNYVRITNYGSETTKVVMADAIRFYSASGGAGDPNPPVISAVGASPGYNTATVTWTTDEPATSQVEYGPTATYGSQTTKNTSLVTGHSVLVTGLSPATLYHYRVKSEDAFGNAAASGDYTFTTTSTPPSGEFRAAWCDGWGIGFQSASQVTTMINTLDNANYNALIPEVRKNGDAFYNSAYENRATSITDPPPFDPLADMIAKGHAKGIEIHPWIVTYRIANSSLSNAPPIYYAHPEWRMKNSSGGLLDGSYYHLDPGVPGVQDYICKIVLDIVSKYDVDGLNFDYIRYPGNTWGYNDLTEQRFFEEYGYMPPTSTSDPNWGVWCSYRRQQVTDLVKKCYLEVMAVKPNVKMSADTITWGGITDFTQTSSYTGVFQDWRKWMQDHILDASIPMDYKREFDATQANDYRDWADFAISTRSGRHAYIGPGVYLNSIADSITQIQYALNAGADGISTYDYVSTNNEGRPSSDFYNAVKTNIFPSPVATPEMPWKTSPTTGIIFGTVTNAAKPNDPIYQNWIYKATVTATGPVTRSTTTDGTGTYGFIDLPPGTYSITASKPGFPSRTYTSQTITAGQVLSENFDLGTTTASSAAGTLNAGWGLVSIPLVPVNPDPASVFAGIDIDSKLYRFDRATQSMILYDVWTPDIFGNVSVDEGYWVQVDTSKTISYQAYGGTAATHTTQLPAAGWAIIGCSFQSNRQWPDTLVTLGATTVPISTARGNGWISGTGYWFDSSTQSMVDFGLPEDFPTGTELRTWHGHWVQSYVNSLTLTLR